ncbi:IPT/TIG domain-containing protein [Streptomyces sp. NPDC004658]|uniref:IPT/TIG domain-containing protein n=1 Tax=Streptomyces sp. NPDC004658 TaxID=3154672 RepID=UPI00339F2BF9
MPPVVSSINPAQGPVSGGTTVIITGTGLTGATAVRFGSVNAASYTVTSSTQISAATPSGSVGPVPVTVISPSGTSNTTVTFTYTASPPAVTGLSPSSGPTSGGTVVTVTGTNLSGATQVRFGSVNASSFIVVSATRITAVSPPGSPGSVPVTVTTPAGTSAAAPESYFFYSPVPTLTAISPSAGPASGNSTVTLTGSNLLNATDVRFGTQAASFTVVSSTEITATPPSGSGQVAVTVTTPGGASNSLTYAYVGSPTLTGVSPSSGPAASITVVTLTGTGLATTTDVKVDGVSVAFTVLSDTQLTAAVPAGAVGDAAIRVTTVGGTSGAVLFHRLAAPEI